MQDITTIEDVQLLVNTFLHPYSGTFNIGSHFRQAYRKWKLATSFRKNVPLLGNTFTIYTNL